MISGTTFDFSLDLHARLIRIALVRHFNPRQNFSKLVSFIVISKRHIRTASIKIWFHILENIFKLVNTKPKFKAAGE